MGEQGKLVVISGPSGAGKTSVCRALKSHPRVVFSVSATTRAMRRGERDGADYHFLSREEFTRRVAAGEFLEHADYNGNLYGTLRAPMEDALSRGQVFVLEIEVQGTRQLRDDRVEGLFVFIVPPSMAVLRGRLVARRSNTEAEIVQRLAIAEGEMEAASLYDFAVVNDDLAQTIAEVERIIGL